MATDATMRSWWLREALPGETDAPALGAALDADFCIVGGGYSGLWTALRLKESAPSLDVVVIEADICGGGASGRNGGFAMTFWHHFAGLEQLCGAEGALHLARASTEAVAEIGRFCEAHGVDAHYRRDGWLWTATNPAQRDAWARTVELIGRHGEQPFTPMTPHEVAERSGSAAHLAGVFEAAPATVQPAQLARGLRRVAIERGIRIFEHTPMVELERGPELVVRTPSGSVTAGKVILAMNAWGTRLRELRDAFVVVASDVIVTEPVPEELERLGWDDGLSISDSRLMVHYYRTTRDGRVVLGKGGGALARPRQADFRLTERRTETVTASLHRLYPSLASVPIAQAWTGPVDRPVDGLPFFTTLGRPDLLAGAGFSGNGVGPAVLGGRILASMALGLDDEWSRCGLVRRPPRGLPPEPLRSVGGRIVQRAVARKERAEDAGRKPAWIDQRLTSLAPAGLVPLD